MTDQQHLQTLTDIKRMMERSSRFISLSGLSGVSAGISALAGAWLAHSWIVGYYNSWNASGVFDEGAFVQLKFRLIILAFCVMGAALAGGLFFTWRRARRNHLPIWDVTSRNVLVNVCIPLAAGGAFIAGLLYNHLETLVAPTCLVFYGLALINGSKYTLPDVRYLGICETVLGIVNLFFLRKGIYFWAVGFGVLHIIYGVLMWWKYERKGSFQ
ncbi:hypothetical protein ECE50_019685 [Chitinophaga sp. Mgbs1]|uniref:Uncharacterized protein n=1 Tax=Chitinophaga solisilvae TaxID=1233460 RepID=A0A9Q5GU68_9BACT|nr:hypothetical protein [Chitinophaga solisilvae]